MSSYVRPTFSDPHRVTLKMPTLSTPTRTPTYITIIPSPSQSPATSPVSFNPYSPYIPSSFISRDPLALDQLPLTQCALIHSVLAYRPGTPLPIAYDAALHPSTASPYGIDEPTLRQCLGHEALSVPTEYLILECPALRSTITVRAGAAVDARSPYIDRTVPLPHISPSMGAPAPRRMAPITVSNVLNAIHHKLHESLPPADFAQLDSATRYVVLRAAQTRCALHPEEYVNGVKRIDLLSAAGLGTRVVGLSPAKRGPQVWVLNFR